MNVGVRHFLKIANEVGQTRGIKLIFTLNVFFLNERKKRPQLYSVLAEDP